MFFSFGFGLLIDAVMIMMFQFEKIQNYYACAFFHTFVYISRFLEFYDMINLRCFCLKWTIYPLMNELVEFSE